MMSKKEPKRRFQLTRRIVIALELSRDGKRSPRGMSSERKEPLLMEVKITRPPINIWEQVVECPTCGEIFNVNQPDNSHTKASTTPSTPLSSLKIMHACSKGHPIEIFWLN